MWGGGGALSHCGCRGDAALGWILWVKREAANTVAAGVDDSAPLKGRLSPQRRHPENPEYLMCLRKASER